MGLYTLFFQSKGVLNEISVSTNVVMIRVVDAFRFPLPLLKDKCFGRLPLVGELTTDISNSSGFFITTANRVDKPTKPKIFPTGVFSLHHCL